MADAEYDAVSRFAAEGLTAFLADWKRRDTLFGREVAVHQHDHGVLHGTARGLADDGALIVERPSGERLEITTGDLVHLR